MADKYAEPLLELDSLIERPKIKIDGELYEIAAPEELSVIDTQRVASLGRRLDNLLKQEGAAQAKILQDTLGDIIAIVMSPVPADVRARLSDGQKMSVVEVFSMLSLARKTQLAGATIPQILKAIMANTGATGEKPQPGSSDTTAATQQAG